MPNSIVKNTPFQESPSTYIVNLVDGANIITDFFGCEVLELFNDTQSWDGVDMVATKSDDGALFNLMVSHGDTYMGDVTMYLEDYGNIKILRLGNGRELDFQAIYENALEISLANLDLNLSPISI